MNLYIHIPFCERICVYCDFYVTTARKYFEPFRFALDKEIQLISGESVDRELMTIYFGGGTPSYLPEIHLQSILHSIHSAFAVHDGAEITLEANPNNLSPEKLERYRTMGINRLSIGIQSFSDEELRFLTRTHDAAQAVDSVRMAQDAGFSNITIDLIFGLPGQSRAQWLSHVQKAIDLGSAHLSIYNLTVEDGTHLHKMQNLNRLPQRDDDQELRMYLDTIELLNRAGYEHYEISNYAKPGFRSIHNSHYWTRQPYRGLGPSAHSFDGRTRWWNLSDVRLYNECLLERKTLPIADREVLRLDQECAEVILLGLRRKEGLSIPEFESLSGRSFDENFSEALAKTSAFWERRDDRLCLTDEGSFLYNRICAELVSAL